MTSADVDTIISNEEDGNGSDCTTSDTDSEYGSDTDSECDFDAPPISPIIESSFEADTNAGNDDSNAVPVRPVTVCAGPTAGNRVEYTEPQQVEETSCAPSSWHGFKFVGDNIDKNVRPLFSRFDKKISHFTVFIIMLF